MSEENMKAAETAAEEMESAPEETKSVQKKKKRKKGGRISVALAAVLLAIALLFGVVAGYAFGRTTGSARLKAAQSQIDELSEAVEESSRNDDVFDAAMDSANEAALSDLAGEGMEAEGNELLGGDDLTGESEAAETGEAAVVAEFKGGRVMSDEAAQAYEEQLALYAFAGYTEEEVSGELIGEVLSELVTDKVLYAKAKEKGLDALSAEDEQEIAKLAQEDYDETVKMIEDFMREEGTPEADVHAEAIRYLEEDEGVTPETALELCKQDWWMNKLYDDIVSGVTVSDADVQSAYADLVKTQQESFEASADDYEFAQMNGELIVYNPAGYRAVREILIAFDEAELTKAFELTEQITALNPDSQKSEIEALEAELSDLYAGVEAKAQAAMAKLNAGADFGEVMDEYDPDSVFQDEELRDTGYSIRAESLLWPQNVIDAALALEKAGDISEPLRVENGILILQYAGDVTEGTRPLDDVREALRGELLESRQYGAYKDQIDAWMKEADPKYYPERMQ